MSLPGLAEVEEMAEGEDEWDLREARSVQSGA